VGLCLAATERGRKEIKHQQEEGSGDQSCGHSRAQLAAYNSLRPARPKVLEEALAWDCRRPLIPGGAALEDDALTLPQAGDGASADCTGFENLHNRCLGCQRRRSEVELGKIAAIDPTTVAAGDLRGNGDLALAKENVAARSAIARLACCAAVK